MTWKVSIEYEREEDGVPRMTGGRQYLSDEQVSAELVSATAAQVFEDVKNAMEP